MSGRNRIYVGNLPIDVRDRDIEDMFSKYGKILMIDLKNRKGPPAFAFVEFDDIRDAEDAVRARNGYEFDGNRLRVEFPRGVGPRGAGGRPIYGDDERDGRRDRYDSRSREPSRRGGYRVVVTGLPTSGSWQDLKDHMRQAGDVCYTDVFKDGTGVVEFSRQDDAHRAVRKLDDSKFRSHEGDSSYIRVKIDFDDRNGGSRSPAGRGRGGGGRSRSRSPAARNGDRDRGRGERRGREPSYSRSRSPPPPPANNGRRASSRSQSRSVSRSRSYSR